MPERRHGVERIGVGIVYLLLAAWVLLTGKLEFRKLAHDAFRAPYGELVE